MAVYYNEWEPYPAQWLRNLIAAGHLPAGDVDERSITDIHPNDLQGYDQCHFFAGIGGWPYALRLAGWPDDQPVWTGSCPCQGLSSAPRGRQNAPDPWPYFANLIATTRPPVVFGEQVVAAKYWIDRVCDDMEAMDYTVWATILPACCVGQDHARSRIYFASHPNGNSQPIGAINGKTPWVPWVGGIPRGVASTNGLSDRVAQLRAYGNAIVPQVAAEFVMAYRETRP